MSRRARAAAPAVANCACGSDRAYPDCCGPYLDDGVPAPDAERLMRSRYTAYVLGREPYLLATWHPDTRPPRLDLGAEPQPRWLGLVVLESAAQDDHHATVRFQARYKVGGRAFRLTETSRFERLGERWYYRDGDTA